MSNENLEKKIMSLRRTLSWMDLVMANVNECILVIDKDWRIVFANSYLAEILGQDRVLLLGKFFWEIEPFAGTKPANNKNALRIESVTELDGIYNFKVSALNLKMLLRSKYVNYLQQAVCIISDVSIELNAGGELMKMQEEITNLKAELARLSSLNI